MTVATFIVDEARRLLNVDACALLVPDAKQQQQLYFKAAAGWRTDPVRLDRRIPADEESKVLRVMTSQKLLVAEVPRDLSSTAFDYWAAAEDFPGFGGRSACC